MKRPYYIQKPIPSNQFIDIGEMVIEVPYPYNDYILFLAECYEAEDEFWKELFEDRVAEDTIMELKEIF
jgi:hypothetical protein